MLTTSQRESVIELLEKAGREIMRIYLNEDYHVRIKEDESPVTLADLASDAIIKSGLEAISRDIPVFSEETKDIPWSERSQWDTLWILDPLDGTKEFIAGFIHSPVTKQTWVAEKGKGACIITDCISRPLPFTETEGPFRVNISRTHHSSKEEEWINNFRKENDIRIEIYGSAIKFCKIAEGYTDVYPKLSLIHEWDIAAGHLIIEESGGIVIEKDTGRAPVYNKEDYHQAPFIAFSGRIKNWKKWIGK
jgi:3'(2'), 5'-bisphosphate nucleotidase